MDDIDIWRAAQLLIEQRDDAELFAVGRVDDMIARGDVAGEATWKMILKGVRALQRSAPREGEAVN